LVDRLHFGAEDADAIHVVDSAVGDEFDLFALFERAVDDADQDDHAEVAIIP